jgi:hypothetical protein
LSGSDGLLQCVASPKGVSSQLPKQRAGELPTPIQMCDALSRNTPKGVEALVANCLADGRRQVVEVAANFPEECRYVVGRMKEIYSSQPPDGLPKSRFG